jgi:hypothetical protein
MKKLKISQGNRPRRHKDQTARPSGKSVDDLEPLSPKEIRELKRRLDDTRDRTRYLLISNLLPRYTMFYNVSEGTFTLNDPREATIFKRRPTARIIRDLVGENGEAVRCRVDAKGRLIPGSLPKGITIRWKRRRLTTRSS